MHCQLLKTACDCHRIKGIMKIDVNNVKNKQLSDQLKHLFSLSNLGTFYYGANFYPEGYVRYVCLCI